MTKKDSFLPVSFTFFVFRIYTPAKLLDTGH